MQVYLYDTMVENVLMAFGRHNRLESDPVIAISLSGEYYSH